MAKRRHLAAEMITDSLSSAQCMLELDYWRAESITGARNSTTAVAAGVTLSTCRQGGGAGAAAAAQSVVGV